MLSHWSVYDLPSERYLVFSYQIEHRIEIESSVFLCPTAIPCRAQGSSQSRYNDYSIATSHLPESLASTASADSACPSQQRIQDAFIVLGRVQVSHANIEAQILLSPTRFVGRIRVFSTKLCTTGHKILANQSNGHNSRGHTTKGVRASSKKHRYKPHPKSNANREQ